MLCATVFSACNIGGIGDGRTLAGVKMTTEKSAYRTDAETITVTWENDTDKNLLFGDSYHIEKKTNGKWKKG